MRVMPSKICHLGWIWCFVEWVCGIDGFYSEYMDFKANYGKWGWKWKCCCFLVTASFASVLEFWANFLQVSTGCKAMDFLIMVVWQTHWQPKSTERFTVTISFFYLQTRSMETKSLAEIEYWTNTLLGCCTLKGPLFWLWYVVLTMLGLVACPFVIRRPAVCDWLQSDRLQWIALTFGWRGSLVYFQTSFEMSRWNDKRRGNWRVDDPFPLSVVLLSMHTQPW